MTRIRPVVAAKADPLLRASVESLTPLLYTVDYPDGESLWRHDLPPHVRSASAIRRFGAHLVIVQDDVNALAVRDQDGEVFPLMLPPGAGGRRMFDDVIGNKADKMDLEACVLLPDERLVAFGSGASAPRCKVAVASRREAPSVREASDLYRSLRDEPAFAGSELNVEGALVVGERLLLFQRGNGARGRAGDPINAVGALDLEAFVDWLDGRGPVPVLADVTRCDLGRIGGAALGFTDAALTADGRIAVIACAEESLDALSDGPVLGCRFGFFDPLGELRMANIEGACWGGARIKLEGIEARPARSDEYDVVADPDEPSRPSLLGCLRVRE
jgi:hypothetical protein